MILDQTEDTHKHDDHVWGTTVRLPQDARSRSSVSTDLPTYEAAQQSPPGLSTVPPIRKRFYKSRRVWKISAISFAVYLLITVLVVVLIKGRNRTGGSFYSSNFAENYPYESFLSAGPISNTINALSGDISPSEDGVVCNQWSSFGPQFLKATYTLPSDVNTELNILSNSTRGLLDALHFNGSLLVSVNPDRSVTDARFDVHIIGSDTAVLERLNLCFHGSVRSKPGIAIYLPDALSEGRLQVSIDVLLPVRAANPRKSPIRGLLFSPFGGLQVYLPMFHQTFDLDGLDEALMSVVIEGASAPITAKYLEALHMRVFNTLGDVIGNYSTYAGSMSIQATKGHVKTNITVYEDLAMSPISTVSLSGTQESSIGANIFLRRPTLKSLATSKEKGLLLVRATTSNAPITLAVRDIRPANSQQANLQLRTRNSLNSTRVSIGSTFQGHFEARAKMSTVKVKDSVKVTTRSNNDTRVYQVYEEGESRVVGSVEWRRPSDSFRASGSLSSFDVGGILGPVYLEFGV